jgi:hypothetical protein
MPEYEVIIKLIVQRDNADDASQAFWDEEDANPEVSVRLLDDPDEVGL